MSKSYLLAEKQLILIEQEFYREDRLTLPALSIITASHVKLLYPYKLVMVGLRPSSTFLKPGSA